MPISIGRREFYDPLGLRLELPRQRHQRLLFGFSLNQPRVGRPCARNQIAQSMPAARCCGVSRAAERSLRCGIDRTDRATGGRTREGDWRNPRFPMKTVSISISPMPTCFPLTAMTIDRQDAAAGSMRRCTRLWYGGANGIDFCSDNRSVPSTIPSRCCLERLSGYRSDYVRASQFQLGRPCPVSATAPGRPQSMTPADARTPASISAAACSR